MLAVFWYRPIKRLPPGLADLAVLLAGRATTTERADPTHQIDGGGSHPPNDWTRPPPPPGGRRA